MHWYDPTKDKNKPITVFPGWWGALLHYAMSLSWIFAVLLALAVVLALAFIKRQ